MKKNKQLNDLNAKTIQNRIEKQVALARLAGKAESELMLIRGRGLQENRKALVESSRDLANQQRQLENGTEAWFKLNKAIEENGDAVREIDQELILADLAFQEQLADERRENAEKARKDAEDAANRARALRDRQLQDEIAAIEIKLLEVEKGSREEVRFQQDLVAAKAKLELNQENLTANEILLIKKKSLADQLKLLADYGKNKTRIEFETEISKNNAELALIELHDDRRLALEIANLNFAAAIEIEAAEGNAAKIEEINARTDRAILDTKKRFIDEAATYEIETEATKNGVIRRALERDAASPDKSLEERIQAIGRLTRLELRAIGTRVDALDESYAQGLISAKDYHAQRAKLIDDEDKLIEDSEERKRAATKKTLEDQKAADKARIDSVIQMAQQVGALLDNLAAAATDQENARLDADKKRLAEQIEAGQITEKDAIARQKRIEAEERRIRTIQARRDKAIGIFKAIISTAQAVVAALAVGPPQGFILAAIAAAIGAVQVAAIQNRPIPQFGKGKKGRYEGFGQIAETGPEIFESGGRQYLVDKKQVVWLNKSDKVYNPQETINLLSKSMPRVSKAIMSPEFAGKNSEFNYEKFGKEVAKNIPKFGLNVDENGFKEWVKEGNSITNYLNSRRGY